MYHSTENRQICFDDFFQPAGLHMNPNNRWIRLADMIPWSKYEKKYSSFFKNDTKVGNISKSFRMALGSLIIQSKYGYSDREVVDQITENPYYQYFVGLPGYQEEKPFDASMMVYFRKRVNADVLNEINLEFLEQEAEKEDDRNDPSDTSTNGKSGADGTADPTAPEQSNAGTLMLDATCAPQQIAYPQDFQLLNDAREKLEQMIDLFCFRYGLAKPRTYRVKARNNYLGLAKMRKRTRNKIRKVIKAQLNYVRRDLKYLDAWMADGYAAPFDKRMTQEFLTIRVLYEQQLYMYENKTHSVENRIVSISQPYIRPIVRGKAKNPVEFGTKLDISIDEKGYARLEGASFDAYNEGLYLQDAVERYKERTGRYPERVLADTIYRNHENRRYCKAHGIRLSGPKLGRPCKATKVIDRMLEYQDNTDRIEVERAFSLAKRCYGLDLIRCKLPETTMTTISLSIFAMNLFKALKGIFAQFLEAIRFWILLEPTDCVRTA